MLPTTEFSGDSEDRPHEPISEILEHRLTMSQLFVPASESRRFARKDAATSFHPTMLPADERTPHPELVKMEKDLLNGADPQKAMRDFKESTKEEEARINAQKDIWFAREEARTTVVETNRFEFSFKSINVDDVGQMGRSRRGVGWRYGVPFFDRKRGRTKIPTTIPGIPELQ